MRLHDLKIRQIMISLALYDSSGSVCLNLPTLSVYGWGLTPTALNPLRRSCVRRRAYDAPMRSCTHAISHTHIGCCFLCESFSTAAFHSCG